MAPRELYPGVTETFLLQKPPGTPRAGPQSRPGGGGGRGTASLLLLCTGQFGGQALREAVSPACSTGSDSVTEQNVRGHLHV